MKEKSFRPSMSWTAPYCSCNKWKAPAPLPCVRPPARHPGGGLPYAVLRATAPCTVAAPRVPAVRTAARPSHFRPRFRFPVLGPLSLSPPMRYLFPHHFAPAAEAVPSSSLRHPSYPLETALDTFFVLRQKGAVFSACCAVSRALHLSKVLLSQLGFHRVHILSLAFRHRSRWRASVYRSSVSLCIYVGGFPPPQRSGLRIRSALRPRSRLGIPHRLRRSGGRHRFSSSSPSFIHARGTGETR